MLHLVGPTFHLRAHHPTCRQGPLRVDRHSWLFARGGTDIEAWKGDLVQALALVENGRLNHEVETGYLRSFNRSPAEEENPTWRASFPALLRALEGRLPERCGVIVEYMLPFNGQRIDVVLVGSDAEGKDTAIAVELKDWA